MISIYIYSLITYRKSLNGFIPNLETISVEEVYILEVSSNSEIKKLSELDSLMFSHSNIIENKYLYKIKCSNIRAANELSAKLDQEFKTITSKKLIKV